MTQLASMALTPIMLGMVTKKVPRLVSDIRFIESFYARCFPV